MGFLQKIGYSFYSAAFYRQLARAETGRGTVFIFIMAVMVFIFAMISAAAGLSDLGEVAGVFGTLASGMAFMVTPIDAEAAGTWNILGNAMTSFGAFFAALVFILFLLGGVFVYCAAATLVSAMVAGILSSILGVSLDFNAMLRIAAAALLPPTLFFLLPEAPMGAGFVWLGYLVFAVWSNRVPKKDKE